MSTHKKNCIVKPNESSYRRLLKDVVAREYLEASQVAVESPKADVCCVPLIGKVDLESIWANNISKYGKEIRFRGDCGICTDPIKFGDSFNWLSCRGHRAHRTCMETVPDNQCAFCKCDVCERPGASDNPLIRFACGCTFHAVEPCLNKYELGNFRQSHEMHCCYFCGCPDEKSQRPMVMPTRTQIMLLRRDVNDHLIFFGPRQWSQLLGVFRLSLHDLAGYGIYLTDLARAGMTDDFFLENYFIKSYLQSPVNKGDPPMILRAYPQLTLQKLMERARLRGDDKEQLMEDGIPVALDVAALSKIVGLTFQDLMAMGLNCTRVLGLGSIELWFANYPELGQKIHLFPDYMACQQQLIANRFIYYPNTGTRKPEDPIQMSSSLSPPPPPLQLPVTPQPQPDIKISPGTGTFSLDFSNMLRLQPKNTIPPPQQQTYQFNFVLGSSGSNIK